jgi:tRNA (guanine-N7-)-methyltransferase
MARTKRKRLSKVKELPNVFNMESETMQSEIQNYFKSGNLFTLEIGCGHGDYSVELAKRFSKRNFVGIDVKGARIFHGAMKALEQSLYNVAFIVGRAEKLNETFKSNSVEEIFILFPEPHFRRASHRRRLISPNFLSIYENLLLDSGIVHFKTDNKELFDYSFNVISKYGCKILFSTEDLYQEKDREYHMEIVTTFEEHYIKEGRSIKYICFRF